MDNFAPLNYIVLLICTNFDTEPRMISSQSIPKNLLNQCKVYFAEIPENWLKYQCAILFRIIRKLIEIPETLTLSTIWFFHLFIFCAILSADVYISIEIQKYIWERISIEVPKHHIFLFEGHLGISLWQISLWIKKSLQPS